MYTSWSTFSSKTICVSVSNYQLSLEISNKCVFGTITKWNTKYNYSLRGNIYNPLIDLLNAMNFADCK